MLARLVSEPGREIHSLELAGGNGGGDAGPLLDEPARRAYGARLRALREEMAEAEAWHDEARLQRARGEAERIAAELARAHGLGGPARSGGAPGERARVNVQRRIASAIRRIASVCPRLGGHLAATVRTGSFCWYDPSSRKRPAP
jgi:hypothetical protein